MPAFDIFISYSHSDAAARDFAPAIAGLLRGTGRQAWFAPDCPSPDGSFPRAIGQGLESSRMLLFLIGSEGIRSGSWHEQELEVAQALRKLVVPVLLAEARAEDIPTLLRATEYVDFRTISLETLVRIRNGALIQGEPTQEAAVAPLLARIRAALGFESYSLSRILKQHLYNFNAFLDGATGAVREEERDNGEPPFLYTESTGFAILDLLALHDLTQNQTLLEYARRAARWIESQALDSSGGVRTRRYLDEDLQDREMPRSFKRRRLYTFDTAICLSAFVDLWNHSASAEKWILEAAQQMGRFLTDLANGSIPAVFDAQHSIAEPDNSDRWSEQFGAFHAKVAAALLELANVLEPGSAETPRLRSAAQRICEEILRRQTDSGAFETSQGRIELHPLCYAAEGLLRSGRLLGETKLIDAARRVTEWILQRAGNGQIPQRFDHQGWPLAPDHDTYRVDALAQTLALAVELDLLDTFSEKLFLLQSVLRSCFTGFNREYFAYGYYEDGTKSRTLSYWTNAFSVKALLNYHTAMVLRNTVVVILAAGQGSRCWPLSTEYCPKVFTTALLNDRSTLQETIRRFRGMVPDRQIFVLVRESTAEIGREQATCAGIPRENVLIEPGPKGSTSPSGIIPALTDAMAQIRTRLPCETFVVSMADNIIEPYDQFHRSLQVALLTAVEKDALVSIGRPVDPREEWDPRFGYMRFPAHDSAEPYMAFHVDHFTEKPVRLEELDLSTTGRWAWETGTLVGATAYFQRSLSECSGTDLARDFLQATNASRLRLYASLLPPTVRFEDLGVPGDNLLRFWQDRRRVGGNLSLGPAAHQAHILYSRNNLLISDRRQIKIYGLQDHLVIDSSDANTAVVMPLSEVSELPNLFTHARLGIDVRPFVIGGHAADVAPDRPLGVSSPLVTFDRESKGLVIAFKCPDNLRIKRDHATLVVINQLLPQLSLLDYDILMAKQDQDLRLVDHLIHVTALATSLVGEHRPLALSEAPFKLLQLLCLYHDFGGYLDDDDTVNKETRVANWFRSHSKLDRRILDSRILLELFRTDRSEETNEELIALFNDSANSAAQLLRELRTRDESLYPDLRDLLILLLQIQDVPELYHAKVVKLVETQKFDCLDSPQSLDTVFACFKIAEHFANGRWLWKRQHFASSFLTHGSSVPLEDLPCIVAFTLDWLSFAGIDDLDKYLLAINHGLADSNPGSFDSFLTMLQGGHSPPICDSVYRRLFSDPPASTSDLIKFLSEELSRILCDPNGTEHFQLSQIRGLPNHIRTISARCPGMSARLAESIHAIEDFRFIHRDDLA